MEERDERGSCPFRLYYTLRAQKLQILSGSLNYGSHFSGDLVLVYWGPTELEPLQTTCCARSESSAEDRKHRAQAGTPAELTNLARFQDAPLMVPSDLPRIDGNPSTECTRSCVASEGERKRDVVGLLRTQKRPATQVFIETKLTFAEFIPRQNLLVYRDHLIDNILKHRLYFAV